MLPATLIFLFTLTLVIWQPKGLGVGWSATFGALLALLCGAKAGKLKMSEVGYRLPKRFTASDRIQNFATASSLALIVRLRMDHAALRELMAPQAGEVVSIDETDGLRVLFASGDIVHLRPSGNAPELRCYAESTTVDQAKQLCDDCLLRVLKVAA